MAGRAVVGTLVAAFVAAGCMSDPDDVAEADTQGPIGAKAPFAFAVPDLEDGGELPEKHTCDGDGVSPAIEFSNPPRAARYYGFYMYDEDGAQGPETVWLWWDIAVSFGGVEEGARPDRMSGHVGKDYAAPCPNDGEHTMVLRGFALDGLLREVQPASDWNEVEAAFEKHKVAEFKVTGSYERFIVPLPVG